MVPLAATPLSNPFHDHWMARRDRDRRRERLPIPPVVEGGEPISARVRGGEREGPGSAANPPDGADIEILADAQRSSREFDDEVGRSQRPRARIETSASKWLAGAPRTPSQPSGAIAKFRLGFEQPLEVALQLAPCEDSRVEAVEPGSAHWSSRDHSIPLERRQSLLHAGKTQVEQAGQLAGI